jgi:signal transduction histidine kinase
MGISDKCKEGLFTLFFRVDNEETRSAPGAGIGLYIVKTIVGLHGGKIEAKSSLGANRRSIFTFPAPTPASSASSTHTNSCRRWNVSSHGHAWMTSHNY